MCFGFDAHPPDLPPELHRQIAGGAAAELLTLTSADGTAFTAALAATPEPRGAGVVILPDVRGLHRFYVELAERFAEAGHHAIAIDYFGRTAGTGERREGFDHQTHMAHVRVDKIQQDATAALTTLREQTEARSVVAVGFCFGGMQAFLAATSPRLDFAGVVGFYGVLDGSRRGMPSPGELTAAMRCPVLGLFGGADRAIPREQVDAFERDLRGDGIPHEIVVYEGAPHSFFDRASAEYAEASADAWRRTITFLRER